jgi:hypothetical protein
MNGHYDCVASCENQVRISSEECMEHKGIMVKEKRWFKLDLEPRTSSRLALSLIINFSNQLSWSNSKISTWNEGNKLEKPLIMGASCQQMRIADCNVIQSLRSQLRYAFIQPFIEWETSLSVMTAVSLTTGWRSSLVRHFVCKREHLRSKMTQEH